MAYPFFQITLVSHGLEPSALSASTVLGQANVSIELDEATRRGRDSLFVPNI